VTPQGWCSSRCSGPTPRPPGAACGVRQALAGAQATHLQGSAGGGGQGRAGFHQGLPLAHQVPLLLQKGLVLQQRMGAVKEGDWGVGGAGSEAESEGEQEGEWGRGYVGRRRARSGDDAAVAEACSAQPQGRPSVSNTHAQTTPVTAASPLKL